MKYLKQILMLGLASLIMWGVYFIVSRQGEASTLQHASENIQESSQQSSTSPSAPGPFVADSLQKQLQTLTDAYPMIDAGVVVLSTYDSTASSIQGDAPFIAASTTKLLVATYALHQVQSGVLTLNDNIAGMPLKEQITRLIVHSDNTAWYALLDYFGYDAVTAYGKQNGAPNFDAANNIVSPEEMAAFTKNIHTNKIINQEHAAFLETLMAQSDTGTINLSSDFSDIIRKAGWLQDRQHLVGIITANNKTVVYAIYTKSKDNSTYNYADGSAFINETLRTIVSALQ